MVGRHRKSNRHLPARVYLSHGGYFFVDKDRRWLPLGRSLAEMYRTLATRVEEKPVCTMSDLFERYKLLVVPGKAEKSHKDNFRYLTRLGKVFGHMRPGEVRPRDVYAYRHRREAAGHVTANRELEILKHVFSKAIEWGVVDSNPAREVRKFPTARRERYVTDEEFQLVRSVAPPMIQAAMDLAVLTGLRRGDILGLTREHLSDDGITIKTSKTGRALLIEWSDELRAVVAAVKSLTPQVRQPLIATRRGKRYTADGFASIWDRTLARAKKAGLTERFHFHDLRAKSASDDTLESATQRLGHMDGRTTERYYRRKPMRVRPLR